MDDNMTGLIAGASGIAGLLLGTISSMRKSFPRQRALEQQAKRLQSELTRQKAELESTQEALQTLRATATQARVVELEAALSALEVEHASLGSELEVARSDADRGAAISKMERKQAAIRLSTEEEIRKAVEHRSRALEELLERRGASHQAELAAREAELLDFCRQPRAVLQERCAEELLRLQRRHADEEARCVALQVDVESRREAAQEDASREAANRLAETERELEMWTTSRRRMASEIEQMSRRLEALEEGGGTPA